jgi:hypothetical protein
VKNVSSVKIIVQTDDHKVMPIVTQEKGSSVFVITRIYWMKVKAEVVVEIVDDRLIMDDFMILNSMTNVANSYRTF